MEDRVNKFNGKGSGYLKPWKANGMLWTLKDIPGILLDDKRLEAYIVNCLTMEGFNIYQCKEIAEYLSKEAQESETKDC